MNDLRYPPHCFSFIQLKFRCVQDCNHCKTGVERHADSLSGSFCSCQERQQWVVAHLHRTHRTHRPAHHCLCKSPQQAGKSEIVILSKYFRLTVNSIRVIIRFYHNVTYIIPRMRKRRNFYETQDFFIGCFKLLENTFYYSTFYSKIKSILHIMIS